MPASDSPAELNRISGHYSLGITSACAVATMRNGELPSTSLAEGLAR